MTEPFRLVPYVAPEADLQARAAEAFRKLLRPPTAWTAFPLGHLHLTAAQTAHLTRIGVEDNWPDHLVLHGGDLIGLEWKRPGEDLSRSRTVHSRFTGRPRWVEGQEAAFPRLTRAGMIGPYVFDTVEAALRVLRAHGVPMIAWEHPS